MTSATPQPRPRGSMLLGLVLGALVGILVIGLAWTLLVPDRTATPAPGPTVTVTAAAPTASVSRTPSATPTPSRTPSPSATPSESPSATPPAGLVTSLEPGSWITVLDSLPKANSTAEQAVARASQLGNEQYRAVAIDSDAIPGLKPGYYAIAVPGAASRQESNAVCAALGITLGDDCYPRQIQG